MSSRLEHRTPTCKAPQSKHRCLSWRTRWLPVPVHGCFGQGRTFRTIICQEHDSIPVYLPKSQGGEECGLSAGSISVILNAQEPLASRMGIQFLAFRKRKMHVT
ncbi:hypothetical protein K469DRAFT_253169 [Zopfia rhizophila CBS 207.26]|uniref:Uncharacterized protein n=1 Tax=Zopfia rhizophila CBS 207.26 TaxID=1314779 RepID=A0A6A6DV70_9PEZI|nr:hypothetical protein K469DRAFT_253169 [Zopfia rhizophila CBS 207.26]